ncbi:hypothetical protein C8F01DRAFT_1120626 [Mycena amicta]|nr:hypothetical protein C8F01DRAFT_1120626 [Mycena amicta]
MSSMVFPEIAPRQLKTALPRLPKLASVKIWHPQNRRGFPIVKIPAFPSSPGSDVVGAGNQLGELHRYAEPRERIVGVDSNPDGLLIPGMYIFVVVRPGGELDYNYPLCASFADWTPPETIPSRWKGDEPELAPDTVDFVCDYDTSTAVKMADEVCVVTGASNCLELSLLFPQSEAAWWCYHCPQLTAYGGDPETDLNSMRNAITLRADLNEPGFEQGHFFLVPYKDCIVSMFTRAGSLAYEYHLRAIRLPARIRRGYLFLRFVWGVFEFLTPGLIDAVNGGLSLPASLTLGHNDDGEDFDERTEDGESADDDDEACQVQDRTQRDVFKMLKSRPFTVDKVEPEPYCGYYELLEHDWR